jgi:hypothetical protein
VDANILNVAAPGDALAVLGDPGQAQAAIGKQEAWLNVRTPGKFVGYVAAWLVQEAVGAPPPAPPGAEKLTVFPTADVNMRAQPSANSPRVSGAFRNDPLTVLESDLDAARAKIGQQELWMYVQNKGGHRGWIAAWFLAKNPA